jgi:hypothetical protein
MTKFYVVGDYTDKGGVPTFNLLNPDGGTMAECKRSISWQGGAHCETPFHICRPGDRVGVMVAVEGGREFPISRGPFTEKAHARHLAEIWPKA